MSKVPSEIISYAKSKGLDSASYVMEWNGFSVYQIYHDAGSKIVFCGLPIFVLAKDGDLREASWDEMQQILDDYPQD